MNNAITPCPIIKEFKQIDLPDSLINSLERLKFIAPTPIQAQAIPLALNHHDILGTAQTGTGKTLAFALPLISHLLANPKSLGLILTPTRELAGQIYDVITNILGNQIKLKLAVLIGGVASRPQHLALRQQPKIIVGTPGRVIDHLGQGSLNPKLINFVVLDETDRMFDMGFGIQLENIMQQLPHNKQTLMFSATLPKNIEKLATNYLKTPKRISINNVTSVMPKIKEETIKVHVSQKFTTLLQQLASRNGTIIIFVKTKNNAEVLSKHLLQNNHKASYIHGDLKQHKRCRVMTNFRNGHYKIMVATDLAARGLDVPHIQHVINYDLPHSPEDYVHRIGRTARAGAEGEVLNLVSTEDTSKWHAIERFRSPDKSYDNNSRHAVERFRTPGKSYGSNSRRGIERFRSPDKSYGSDSRRAVERFRSPDKSYDSDYRRAVERFRSPDKSYDGDSRRAVERFRSPDKSYDGDSRRAVERFRSPDKSYDSDSRRAVERFRSPDKSYSNNSRRATEGFRSPDKSYQAPKVYFKKNKSAHTLSSPNDSNGKASYGNRQKYSNFKARPKIASKHFS